MKKLFLLLPLFLMLSGFAFPEDKHLVKRDDIFATQTAISKNFGLRDMWYPFVQNESVKRPNEWAQASMDKNKGQFVVFVKETNKEKVKVTKVIVDSIPKQHVEEVLSSFGIGYSTAIKDVVNGKNGLWDHASDSKYEFLLANSDGTFTFWSMYEPDEISDFIKD